MGINVGRAEAITERLRGYDPMLYCEKSREGKLCVYRKGQRIESYFIDEVESVIQFVRPAPFFIFAVTDDWSLHGQSVDWGIEPIMQRVKRIDSWNRDVAEECLRQAEEKEASVTRDRQNKTESFLKDFRRGFAKATNDINTSTLAKKDSRKTRRIKDGYC